MAIVRGVAVGFAGYQLSAEGVVFGGGGGEDVAEEGGGGFGVVGLQRGLEAGLEHPAARAGGCGSLSVFREFLV